MCSLVVLFMLGTGVKKTYKLTYEPTEPVRVVFDSTTARNRWKISAHILKAFSEFFGARTENLEMCYDAERVTFDCFTEKIVHGAGMVPDIRAKVLVDNIQRFSNSRYILQLPLTYQSSRTSTSKRSSRSALV